MKVALPSRIAELTSVHKHVTMSSSLCDRYVSAMVLSGVGDALGYKNGSWEFCHSGIAIFKELTELGGLENIPVRLPNWMVSDDTVMHLATGEALVKHGNNSDREKLFLAIAQSYKNCMSDMRGRAPGNTCMFGAHQLRPLVPGGYKIPFNPRGGGCGAAMRAMCIGLRYPKPEQLNDLIAMSVESGRMTHHNPVGYLGALAAALFTAYAIQGKPAKCWGRDLMETLPLALDYIKSSGHSVKENVDAWDYFCNAWRAYLESRGLTDGESDPVFPEPYGFKERDEFVKKVSFSGWGGASGHDAPMIAYDAFLAAGSSWEQLCYRSMFHGGDSDSTGVIAACWYGVTYGLEGVPILNHRYVEYRSRLVKVGERLYMLAFPEDASTEDSQNNGVNEEIQNGSDEMDNDLNIGDDSINRGDSNRNNDDVETNSADHKIEEGEEDDTSGALAGWTEML